jgi:TPR repeat protein
MKNPLLLGLLALFVVPSSLASAQSDNAKAAFERKDVTALKAMAEAGDPIAQTLLGSMYNSGEGVVQDNAIANSWFRKAADQGKLSAQFLLGRNYEKGIGTAQDYLAAAYWYRKAAYEGYADAQINLGFMYYYGRGVTQYYSAAADWFRKAADQGYAPAQKALRMAEAEAGDPVAQLNLGFDYYYGRGVTQDYAIAVSWFRKAANQGDKGAQTSLGIMYVKGSGVKQNYTTAISWLRKAADQGYAPAQKALRGAEAEAAEQMMKDPAFLAQYDRINGDASFFHKGYKISARKGVMPIVNSCLDLIIKRYNLSYTNKYGKLIQYKKLYNIDVLQQSQKSLRNGANFKTQPYSITFISNGKYESDLIYCESKNGVALGIEDEIM